MTATTTAPCPESSMLSAGATTRACTGASSLYFTTAPTTLRSQSRWPCADSLWMVAAWRSTSSTSRNTPWASPSGCGRRPITCLRCTSRKRPTARASTTTFSASSPRTTSSRLPLTPTQRVAAAAWWPTARPGPASSRTACFGIAWTQSHARRLRPTCIDSSFGKKRRPPLDRPPIAFVCASHSASSEIGPSGMRHGQYVEKTNVGMWARAVCR